MQEGVRSRFDRLIQALRGWMGGGGESPTENNDDDEDEGDVFEKEMEELQEKVVQKRLTISKDFISEMREAFYLFDKDGSGYICSKEMGYLLRALGWNPTQAEVHDLMAVVDIDHNGKMDLTEFILMMHKQVGSPDTMEDIKMAFRAFDTDGDGKVSKDDIRRCMYHFGEGFQDEDLEEMIEQADQDSNGYIDFDEFVKMVTQDSFNRKQSRMETTKKLAKRGMCL